jgi:signal transduction histidine kinase
VDAVGSAGQAPRARRARGRAPSRVPPARQRARPAQHRHRQTHDLAAKNDELAQTLAELRAAQARLIAQERLASLGALSTGIAREIKNPLNFVNNFAELSVELSAELKGSLASQRGRVGEDAFADMDDLVASLAQNSAKINEHGRRAAGIIDRMIAHAQGSPGAREVVELAALVAESVELARQKALSRSPDYDVAIRAEYDASVGAIELSPRDIRRALVNVLDNACYATEKRQASSHGGFSPAIEVRTANLGDRVEVRIRDNGTGIPASVAGKVFDPFFTTKPTNEATGLGLYIAHEIVVRGHQGEMRFESVEGEFTEFVIDLPRRSAET